MAVYTIETSEPLEKRYEAGWNPPVLYSTREKAEAAADDYCHTNFPDDPRPTVIAIEVL